MQQISRIDRVLIPVVGFLAAAILLTALGLLARANYFDGFDLYFRAAAQREQSPGLTSLFLTVTLFGSTWVLIGLGLLVIAVLGLFRKWQTAGFFLITMAGQVILDQSFKAIFDRERPEALIQYATPIGSSFPSGHALASVSFYVIVAWLLTRSVGSPIVVAIIWIASAIFILLIGTSRVYIGVHNASDVMGGFLGGAIWAFSMMISDHVSRRGTTVDEDDPVERGSFENESK